MSMLSNKAVPPLLDQPINCIFILNTLIVDVYVLINLIINVYDVHPNPEYRVMTVIVKAPMLAQTTRGENKWEMGAVWLPETPNWPLVLCKV